MMDAFADPEFIADATRQQLSVGQPRSGEQLQAQIIKAYQSPPELIARLRRLAEQ